MLWTATFHFYRILNNKPRVEAMIKNNIHGEKIVHYEKISTHADWRLLEAHTRFSHSPISPAGNTSRWIRSTCSHISLTFKKLFAHNTTHRINLKTLKQRLRFVTVFFLLSCSVFDECRAAKPQSMILNMNNYSQPKSPGMSFIKSLRKVTKLHKVLKSKEKNCNKFRRRWQCKWFNVACLLQSLPVEWYNCFVYGIEYIKYVLVNRWTACNLKLNGNVAAFMRGLMKIGCISKCKLFSIRKSEWKLQMERQLVGFQLEMKQQQQQHELPFVLNIQTYKRKRSKQNNIVNVL